MHSRWLGSSYPSVQKWLSSLWSSLPGASRDIHQNKNRPRQQKDKEGATDKRHDAVTRARQLKGGEKKRWEPIARRKKRKRGRKRKDE